MRCIVAAGLLLAATACGGGDLTAPAPSGTLEIVTATSGSPPDADGYTVQIDSGAPHPIAANDTLRLTLAPGLHSVLLGGLAVNCATSVENPRATTVLSGNTATLTFAVTCGDATGRVAVTVTTSGTSPDPDGYFIIMENGLGGAVGNSGTVTLGPLSPGGHSVQLRDLAPNCFVLGEPTRNVTVAAGSTTAVEFKVSCPTNTPIAFTSNGFGLLGVFIVNPDGTGLRQLSRSSETASAPAWAPDGRSILFNQGGVLHVINPDGSNESELTGTEGAVDYHWSPDGLMIAYLVTIYTADNVVNDLWVAAATGSGKRKLATNVEGLSWAPDSRRIVYVASFDPLDRHLRVVDADGSGDRRLTHSLAAYGPAWSPDGARIAFWTLGDEQIYLINPDGTGEINLTQGRGLDFGGLSWSPDGSRLAFVTSPIDQPSVRDIGLMNRDGSGRTVLARRPGSCSEPRWSPEGQRLAFTYYDGFDQEIFVMTADGSHQVNITNRPGTLETQADWAPLPSR